MLHQHAEGRRAVSRPPAQPCPARPLDPHPSQVDWRDQRHWRCNNNVHPSRHGTYAGLAMHPFETVFLKASWHVGEPFVQRYSEWALAQVRRRRGRERVWGSALACVAMGAAPAAPAAFAQPNPGPHTRAPAG